ncbi:hypothetical protein QT231_02860 [Halomonas sp. SpR1]|uniref:hypothetical protein n=1 Tax=Halomonas sp. SpR1 TaxID=3050462 RepID=UPI0027E40475|nr:hypothetical protein [Halomonas sp. SpR1]MDQ7731622.1 hypothetical protein [Halomonas sp. SpR1]
MFNGSAFNSTAYNSGATRVRVLMASAILSASMSSVAEPLHAHAGVAEGNGSSAMEVGGRLAIRASADGATASLVEGLSWAKRAAGVVSYPTAYLFADRPRDLASAFLSSEVLFLPEEAVSRFGGVDGEVTTAFDVHEVVHRFFSDSYADAELTAWGVVTRYGHSAVPVDAVLDALATRIQRASVSGAILATADLDGDIYAGGITDFYVSGELFAEAHINGIQPGYTLLSVTAHAQSDGDRLAGAFTDAEVAARLTAESIPGRGAEVNDGIVSASLEAVWWTYTQETADIAANAHITALPTRTHAAQAAITANAEGEAIWTIIVEPRERIVASTARLEATPWRIRRAYSDGGVVGTFEEDGRVALRGTALLDIQATLDVGGRLALRGDTDSSVTADLYAEPVRIVHCIADMSSTASVIRSRLSVNITNPAPEYRQMVVPEDQRTMRIPYEHRTMVVS